MTVVFSLASECHGHGYQVTHLNVFSYLKLNFRPTIGNRIRRTLFTSRNNSVEFSSPELDCNQVCLPRVRATLSGIGRFENGNEIFFGGTCKTV